MREELLAEDRSSVAQTWRLRNAVPVAIHGPQLQAMGNEVAVERLVLMAESLERLAQRGLGFTTGLEVEFHIYRLTDATPQLDPERAAWPGLPPAVQMVHPGYQLHGEAMTDMAEDALRIVERTALGLGLPLQSLEIELGPSQVEAVFDVTDALTAADNMVPII